MGGDKTEGRTGGGVLRDIPRKGGVAARSLSLLDLLLPSAHTRIDPPIDVPAVQVPLCSVPDAHGRGGCREVVRCDIRGVGRHKSRRHVLRQSHGRVGRGGIGRVGPCFLPRPPGRYRATPRQVVGVVVVVVGRRRRRGAVVALGLLEAAHAGDGMPPIGIANVDNPQRLQSGSESDERIRRTRVVRTRRRERIRREGGQSSPHGVGAAAGAVDVRQLDVRWTDAPASRATPSEHRRDGGGERAFYGTLRGRRR